MFQWVRVGLGGVVRHDSQAAVTTMPKQIDRGTACPLGRGLEVLCGVRLIIIILFILYIISLLINLVYNYRSFNRVITISRNIFFNTTYLHNKGNATALRLLLAI